MVAEQFGVITPKVFQDPADTGATSGFPPPRTSQRIIFVSLANPCNGRLFRMKQFGNVGPLYFCSWTAGSGSAPR
jgi:hypothetical protein